MKYAAILVLSSAIAIGACTSFVKNPASPDRNDLRATAVCSLVGPNGPPSGTKVRINALFLTDYLERSAIADRACPSVQIALYVDPDAPGEEASRYQTLVVTSTMRDYIEGRRTGVYAIDVAGRFVYRKNEQPHVAIFADRVWTFKRLPCTAFYSATECEGMD